jgi:hypothetical protein
VAAVVVAMVLRVASEVWVVRLHKRLHSMAGRVVTAAVVVEEVVARAEHRSSNKSSPSWPAMCSRSPSEPAATLDNPAA